ncbi:hypothetical protein EYB45_02545 [Erythrobacteraceae bacterium CFH 75059]|nr:hypothetical protein [Qipengyuania thermophila]TCD06607.1 hypothetical protein EYB45_02545 [Erythrobacteraceae bacterium CFH 75059]
MTPDLDGYVRTMLARPVDPAVTQFAALLARSSAACAVLFYGSNLRTGTLDGVLDFYLLTAGPQRERIWPRIAMAEHDVEGRVLRAKTATMSLAQFARAAGGQGLDTTIWTRFSQPSALVWVRDAEAAAQVRAAVAMAVRTAAATAAALGPREGAWEDCWCALFRETYGAELRVERRGRGEEIVATHAAHFAAVLPLAWQAGGIPFEAAADGRYRLLLDEAERAARRRWWARRRRVGRPLNLIRLLKAAWMLDGAADYAAWKLERHTGVALTVTPWRRRHPLLAIPGAALELRRRRHRQRRPVSAGNAS